MAVANGLLPLPQHQQAFHKLQQQGRCWQWLWQIDMHKHPLELGIDCRAVVRALTHRAWGLSDRRPWAGTYLQLQHQHTAFKVKGHVSVAAPGSVEAYHKQGNDLADVWAKRAADQYAPTRVDARDRNGAMLKIKNLLV